MLKIEPTVKIRAINPDEAIRIAAIALENGLKIVEIMIIDPLEDFEVAEASKVVVDIGQVIL